jgi:hypothetical protein
MRRQATVCQSISSRILMLKLSGSVMPSPPSIPNGVDGSADSELLSATPGAPHHHALRSCHNALGSSGTSSNFLITLASLKSPMM